MDLKKWALLAEILSAVAVVTSLVFVGLQIRQGAQETALNTRAIETSAFQDLTTQINTISLDLSANPQLAELAARVLQGGKLETPQEVVQIQSFLFAVNRHGELAFRQFESGLMDELSMIGMLGPVEFWIQSEVGREIWSRQTSLNASYRAYVDSLVATRPSPVTMVEDLGSPNDR